MKMNAKEFYLAVKKKGYTCPVPLKVQDDEKILEIMETNYKKIFFTWYGANFVSHMRQAEYDHKSGFIKRCIDYILTQEYIKDA